MYTDESMRCPKCKRITVGLVPLNDSGEGQRVCKDCKKKIKESE